MFSCIFNILLGQVSETHLRQEQEGATLSRGVLFFPKAHGGYM